MSTTPLPYTEKGFEDYIEEKLLNHGYHKGMPENYDKNLGLDPMVLLEFLEKTQHSKLENLKNIYKGDYKNQILKRIRDEINKRGVLDVLRHQVKDYGVYLDLAYFKPASKLNLDSFKLYQENILTVTRQLQYSNRNANSIDLLISLNGIPLVVIEIKNEFTGQNVQHAIQQFRIDRDPSELLFQWKNGAIVFFAVDTNEAYMSTQLNGAHTFFLPFNKGHEGGKGNPEIIGGFRTDYLWEEVFEKDSILDIIHKFVFIQKEEQINDLGKKNTAETVIFPRYHQWDVIKKIETDAIKQGSGRNYLIQHSAGSGKTNSISWLTHRLCNLHAEDDKSIFDCIIVVTDRVVLDRQLKDAIFQLEHKHGVAEKIEGGSKQLAGELKKGTRILVVTLQTFPFVIDKLDKFENKKFAIIMDEAHSSTGGEKYLSSIKDALKAADLEETVKIEAEIEKKKDETEDKIYSKITSIGGRKKYLSFFAFTATPKNKTMELFGSKGTDGKFHPFHLYSMRQAIEEGFILDVLQNYVTYDVYFKISKKIADDPKLNPSKTIKVLTDFVSLHPYNIAQKTEIMIEHFNSVTRHKIGGKAKAMVVTSSRKHAVRYKIAFDKYIKEKRYDIKTLVAFSGVVSDEGIEYKETRMNNMGEQELPKQFASNQYHVLIVAEKYQTGFDQPLLHTMFVDKKLADLKAVQTLSRLNRIHKDKNDTFILDFVNNAQDIQEAFKPYYENTVLEESTDPNLLYDLENELEQYQIYTFDEIERFVKLFLKDKDKITSSDKGIINNIVDQGVNRYIKLTEQAKEEFNRKGIKFTRLYSFILQISNFTDVKIHKLYIYMSYLIRKLPKGKRDLDVNILEDIALEYYTKKKIFDGSLSLQPNQPEKPLIPVKFTGDKNKDDKKETLSSIIERLNEKFGTTFTLADQLSLEQIKQDFAVRPDLVEKAKVNPIEEFTYAYKKAFMDIVIDRMDLNNNFFKKIIDESEFKNAIMEMMLVEIYYKLKKTPSTLSSS